jgi:tetratricopeptide (TPR) repeat protein
MKKTVLLLAGALAVFLSCATAGSGGTAPVLYQVPQVVPPDNTVYEGDGGRAVMPPVGNPVSLEEAVAEAVTLIEERTQRDGKIALAKIASPLPELSDFLGGELDKGFTATGKLTVLARGQTLEQVNAEQKLQMSGLVSDESAVSIGKFLGADVVITGDFTRFANFSQLFIRAVDVETAQILAAYTAKLDNSDPVLADITAPLGPAKGRLVSEEALEHLNLGREYYAAGIPDIAIEEFDKAIAKSPELGEAYLYRGHAYRTKKDFDHDRAIADYTAALNINPGDTDALRSRAWGYHWAKGDYDRAIADYTAALRINSGDTEALSGRASAYESKGDYDRAIWDYDAMLRINPNDASALGNRGYAYALRGNDDKAIADVIAALGIDPNNLLYLNLGARYLQWKEYDQSIALYNAVLRVKPNDYYALYYRGRAYLDKGDYDRAIAEYNQYIRFNPNDAGAYNNRGSAYAGKGEPDKAIVDYETALRIDPNRSDAREGLEKARKARGIAVAQAEPDVYVAGFEEKANGKIACYWKNGVQTDLTRNTDAGALAIAVSGGDVHVVGWEENNACYWKNGVKTVLPGGRTGGNIYAQANAVTVSGGDVYVAGWVNKQGNASLACYWKNGVMIPLTDGKTHADITDIAVSGNDVYVSGSESGAAYYWRNGIKSALTDGKAYAGAKAIAVSGNDVYVAGLERNAACYWKNGVKTELTDGRQPAIAEAIVVLGRDVYVAGTEIFAGGGACYWKNGVKTALTNGSASTSAAAIAVSGSNVCVAGYESNAAHIAMATYWRNGFQNLLTGGKTYAYAHGIAFGGAK